MVLKLPEYGQKIHEIHVTFVSVVYWPGLDNDIDKIILTCKQCQEHLPSNPREPITIKPRPGRPFPELAADFCSYASQDFLILVDCYSDWPGHPHGPQYHHTPINHCPQEIFLPLRGARYPLVRLNTSPKSGDTSTSHPHSTHNWQNRRHCEVNEEAH